VVGALLWASAAWAMPPTAPAEPSAVTSSASAAPIAGPGGDPDGSPPETPEIRRLTGAPSADRDGGWPLFFPRFLLFNAEYPQLVAAAVGGWMLAVPAGTYRGGLVADVEVGFSGPSFLLGLGATNGRPSTPVEHLRSFGVQAVIHRTWPRFGPWLPDSTTFLGAELFGHLFAYRCSLGAMWNVSQSSQRSSPVPIAGCGIGWP
jgi:hypothetical protein